MGYSRVLAVLAGMAFASAPAGAEDKREPKLASVTDAQLKEGISARAGRNYAWMGYNTPEIHLQLPAVDNSAYTEVTFDPPKLLDKTGKAVAYEVERGLYDAETHRDEVRFVPKDAKPDAPPVEFARAVGTIKIRYPAAGRTVVIKPGAAPVAAGAAKVSATPTSLIVDAPSGWKMLEAPFNSGLEEPLRVYDAAGKRLEEDRSQQLMEGRDDGGQNDARLQGQGGPGQAGRDRRMGGGGPDLRPPADGQAPGRGRGHEARGRRRRRPDRQAHRGPAREVRFARRT